MRWSFILLALAATGCVGRDGSWPSLARWPIEGPRPLIVAADAVKLPVSATAAAPLAVVPAAIGDVPAKLATIDRDATNLATRIAEQRVVAAEAATAAKGSKPDGDAWAKAQLELTRLERLGSQAPELRGQLDEIAGALAAAAAAGTDVAAPLKATGAVIGRVDALQADYDAAYARASAAATP